MSARTLGGLVESGALDELRVLLGPDELGYALEVMPTSLYEPFRRTLMDGYTIAETAELLCLTVSRVSTAQAEGALWLVQYLKGESVPVAAERRRELVLAGGPAAQTGSTRGRPPLIAAETDSQIAQLYLAGLTEQEIADRLNVSGRSPTGKEWRKSSIQRALNRQNVPRRPRGRRPARMNTRS